MEEDQYYTASAYNATRYEYDAAGRLVETVDPAGTITETVYNGINQVTSTWIGTSDGSGTTPSNLVDVEDDYYDGNTPVSASADEQTPGDGNLTEVIDHPGGGQADQVAAYFYDWQDRAAGELDGVNPGQESGYYGGLAGGPGAILHVTQYDQQDEPIISTQFAAGGLNFSDSDFVGGYVAPAGGQPMPNGLYSNEHGSDLRAMSETSYDDQGRVYQTKVFSVTPLNGSDPSAAGTVGAPITTNVFYDHAGNEIATESPTGLWTKSFYDGADRLIEQDQTNGAGGSGWAAAGSIGNDVVFSQMLYKYDGDDNVIMVTEKDRLAGDSPSATGVLGGSSTAAYTTYTGSYYDAADRDIADVNVGTDGGSTWIRPRVIPTRSATTLVTSYAYDPAGNVAFVTDPNNLITAYGYDLLGRTTLTVANWTNPLVGPVNTSTLPAPTDSTNQTTEYSYDGNGNVISLTAEMPEGEASQTTDYVYGVNNTSQGSFINSNDLLAKVEYPDPTTGNAGTSSADTETYTYDALGETSSYTDRNGTTHQYSYDTLGRLTGDTITHFGNSNIDQSVTKLGYTYDDAGEHATATSYNASGGIVNQVAETYDGFGQLASDAQAHAGSVGTGTPTVSYGYDASNGDRLTSMTYPSGRTINYNYSTGLDSIASRISSISDNNNGLIQSYQYQGVDTPMVSTSGNGVVGTTVLGTFGRISSLTYTNSSGGVIDGFDYTYDGDGNVLSRTNLALSSLSETYGYDNLNRLTSFTRGTSTSESWNYNALGDWNSETVNGVTTSRNNNAQNQAYNISGSTLSYDANGNTLSNQVAGQTYVYDAWNQLVAVKNTSGAVIASYTYDALGRRITQTEGGVTIDLYYSNEGQVIEEQQAGVTVAQYVWSPFYVNQLVQETNSHGTFYVEQDANYNVTSISNSSGSIVERYVYDPYGQVTVLTVSGTVLGIGLTNSAYGQTIGFQGEYSDPDTDLIGSLTRWLNPGTGQWNTQDPTGAMYVNGPDLGQLDGSNPVSYDDPSGLGW